MSKVDVRTNANEIRMQLMLDQREYSVAAVRALNRAIDRTRTEAIRKLRETYNVKAGFLRNEAFFVRRATRNNLAAILRATGDRLRLIGFDAKQNKAGVSVAVKKGARKTITHAFIARMPSGHLGVFARNADKTPIRHRLYGKRGPLRPSKHSEHISELYTLSVPGMMSSRDIDRALESIALTSFTEEMERQGRLIVGRRNG